MQVDYIHPQYARTDAVRYKFEDLVGKVELADSQCDKVHGKDLEGCWIAQYVFNTHLLTRES